MSTFELNLPLKPTARWKYIYFYIAWALLGVAISYAILELLPLLAMIAGLESWIWLLKLSAFVTGGLLYVYVPFQIALSQSQCHYLLLNEVGIGLPPALSGLLPSRWINWSEITTCMLEEGTNRLCIGVDNASRASISMADLEKSEQEQLLLAIESRATGSAWSQSLLAYRDELQTDLRGIGQYSHTALFDEELGRRFSPPTFVPLEPGRKLRSGSITIVQQLAFGGFAAVYLVEDQVHGRVVLKESVVTQNATDSTEKKANELFAREAATLQRLEHPGIVRVFDYFIEDGRSYMTMEHAIGETLCNIVRRSGPQEEKLVIGWMIQLVDVLEYLHNQAPPLVHRDVTPENIIIGNTGKLMLIDFGASNEYLGSMTGTLVGKHSYMPVEQIRGKAEPASDIYALGATMYFLLTGNEPSPLKQSLPKNINSNISDEINALVAQATDCSSNSRISDAKQLRKRLMQLLENPEKVRSEARR